MNLPQTTNSYEPWWKTYVKAVVFVTPAVSALAFSMIYLLPKLQEIWKQAGFSEPSAYQALSLAAFALQNGFLILLALALILALLEWRSTLWPRYRRAFVGTATFIVNTTVLIFITAMFATALMAAPALMHARGI